MHDQNQPVIIKVNHANIQRPINYNQQQRDELKSERKIIYNISTNYNLRKMWIRRFQQMSRQRYDRKRYTEYVCNFYKCLQISTNSTNVYKILRISANVYKFYKCLQILLMSTNYKNIVKFYKCLQNFTNI